MVERLLPYLFIPNRVLDEIIKESIAHPVNETGAALIGVEADGFILILGNIPDIVNIQRSPGLFVNGGEYQAELYRWYNRHWEMMREKSRIAEYQPLWDPRQENADYFIPENLDLDLSYLGDWHKHPGRMIQLSHTDVRQIRSILRDPEQERPQLLSPIVTRNDSSKVLHKVEQNHILVIDGRRFRITWYYSARWVSGTVQINPMVVPDENVPRLPPVPWHLKDPKRLDDEILFLKTMGCDVEFKLNDVDSDSICEVIFAVDHPNWTNKVIAVTKWDYPKSRATIRLLGKKHLPVVEEIGKPAKASRLTRLLSLGNKHYEPKPLPAPRRRKSSQIYLCDLIMAMEGDKLGV